MAFLRLALTLLSLATPVAAFNYAVVDGDDTAIVLTDLETKIGDIRTVFVDEPVEVTVTGIAWEALSANDTTDSFELRCETFVGDELQRVTFFDLSEWGERDLETELSCGNLTIGDKGRHTISATLSVDDSSTTASAEFETFGQGAAIVPLIVVLVLAMATQMVEFSLFFAIFVGACMVEGTIKDGFKQLLEDYLLNAIVNEDHAYVYLFTLFLSGLVGMMEKSGGMLGFTKAIGKYATTSRAGQFATFCIGILVFFDDYANTLLAGQTMRPLTDLLFVSREKLAYIVDATAAPIASISPISSWVGFEVSLIETEIERIIEIYGEDQVTIKTSGLAVFFQSIKYRYYPIFMLIIMPLLIFAKRDFGPMLIAERKTQVYERTDGGDAAGRESTEMEQMGSNSPRPDTPKKPYNMLVPILLLVFFIFYLLVKTGEDGSDQSFMDKIENSNSYKALLWGTMAAANITTFMYWFQIVQNGELVIPTWPVIKAYFFPPEEPSETVALKDSNQQDEDLKGAENAATADEEALGFISNPRSLMSLYETVEAFLYGMGRIFPALIVLTLAWASGSIMVAVGADRLFSRWITGGVSAEWLPTLSFIISGFMALATGTSWGTMTILFPLICLPTYEVSGGDETIFYATVAGILSGSVAGDHVSPISDTTVLSALATDCNLLSHVVTQAPYAVAMSLLAVLFGTIPIGKDAWPNIIGILLGAATIVLIVYGVCVPILSPTGRWDVFTALYLKCKGPDHPLHKLGEDTRKKAAGEEVEREEEGEGEVEASADEVIVPEEPAKEDAKELDPKTLPVEVGEGTPEGTDTKEVYDEETEA